MIKEAEDIVLLTKIVAKNEYLNRKNAGSFLTTTCLSALEYQAVHEGVLLCEKQRRSVLAFLELGKAINNHYDHRNYSNDQIRRLQDQIEQTGLKGEEFAIFYSGLRDVERNRPDPWTEPLADVGKITKYREQTNTINIAASVVSMGGAHMSDLVTPRHEFTDSTPTWIKGMHQYVMAMQIVDDQIGWKEDLNKKRPSFFTGLCPKELLAMNTCKLPDNDIQSVFNQMDVLYDAYIGNATLMCKDASALRTAIGMFHILSNYKFVNSMFKIQGKSPVTLVDETDLRK
jgi:hypothetical protein